MDLLLNLLRVVNFTNTHPYTTCLHLPLHLLIFQYQPSQHILARLNLETFLTIFHQHSNMPTNKHAQDLLAPARVSTGKMPTAIAYTAPPAIDHSFK